MKQITLFVVSLIVFFTIPLVSYAGSVNIGIGIGIPAPLTFVEPPDVVVVPSGDAYVYMVPDTPGMYFYSNYWYRYDRGHWYRSRVYDGSWAYIEPNHVPRYVMDVPPDYYRRLPRGYNRIHYDDLHTHWRSWDHDRHWNKYDWYKRERHEHERWRSEQHRPSRDVHDDHDRYNDSRHNDNRHDNARHDDGRRNDRRQDNVRYDDGRHNAARNDNGNKRSDNGRPGDKGWRSSPLLDNQDRDSTP